ncbi:MAG: GHMP family kinase ATP-binding protein [Candidatus Helarchaeota archaeon]
MPPDEIIVKAPGRVCLFGEHQDYLGLPVIAAAISLYIELRAIKIAENELKINLRDTGQQEIIPLNNREVKYKSNRDYLRSAYNLFIRKGYYLKQGYQCDISGIIPIGAGAASSSALVIAWITFLSHIFKVRLRPENIADLGFQAEVDEFGEAGGRMDHYASTLGGILYLNTIPPFNFEQFAHPTTGLILVDSGERKDTVQDLRRVREQMYICLGEMKRKYPSFNLHTTSLEEIEAILESMLPEVANKIRTCLINRNITQKAKNLLSSSQFSPELFGELLNRHHAQLCSGLGVSTPKIEELIAVAKEAGALGCKINGSGFGGSMITYAPNNMEEVAEALETAGGKPYQISISEGCKLNKL